MLEALTESLDSIDSTDRAISLKLKLRRLVEGKRFLRLATLSHSARNLFSNQECSAISLQSSFDKKELTREAISYLCTLSSDEIGSELEIARLPADLSEEGYLEKCRLKGYQSSYSEYLQIQQKWSSVVDKPKV